MERVANGRTTMIYILKTIMHNLHACAVVIHVALVFGELAHTMNFI